MSKFIDRLSEVVETHRSMLPELRNNTSDLDSDVDGSASFMLANTVRFLAVAEYVLNKDIESLRSGLKESANIQLNLFERFEVNEPIDPPYVSMLSYKELFDALASGERELSRKLAIHMGGRLEIEKEFDHPFDRSFGYVLKAFTLDSKDKEEYLSKFFSECEKKGNSNFLGYSMILEGILENNEEKGRAGLKELFIGHRNLSKGRSIFKNSEDELLCIWGLGMVNLASYYDLSIFVSDPLIPEDLISF